MRNTNIPTHNNRESRLVKQPGETTGEGKESRSTKNGEGRVKDSFGKEDDKESIKVGWSLAWNGS